MSLAIPKAAAAANPPITRVWRPLRSGGVPVKCPYKAPKTNKATRVTTTETCNAVCALGRKI